MNNKGAKGNSRGGIKQAASGSGAIKNNSANKAAATTRAHSVNQTAGVMHQPTTSV